MSLKWLKSFSGKMSEVLGRIPVFEYLIWSTEFSGYHGSPKNYKVPAIRIQKNYTMRKTVCGEF